MAGIPKVKIQFDADLDGLKKGTASADKEVAGFADKVGEFGKKAAAAFAVAAAAAAAYASKLAIDGVRAALDDEKAQRILALTLENTTAATNAQIAAVEDYILQTALATGVTDDQLRPAFARLVRSTKDVEEAQKVLNLALDIASATGKPLETITASLAKAYDGNTNALGRLGLGLDQSVIKSKDFNLVFDSLRGSFAGFAANEAQTFQGRIDRLNVAFDEVKETIGFALLPIFEKLLNFVIETVFPVFKRFSDSLGGSGDGLLARFTDIYNFIRDFLEPIFDAVRGAFVKIGDAIRDQQPRFQSIIDTFADIFKWLNQYIIPILKTQFVAAIETFASAASVAIKVVVPVIETVLNTIKGVINGIISVINTAIDVYNKANNLFGGKDISKIGKIGQGGAATSGTVGGVQLPFGGATLGGGATGATGNALGSGIGAGIGSALGTALGSAVGNSAAKAVKELPKTLIEEISEANWLKKTIDEGVFDAARFRMGEERSMLPPVPSMPTFDVAAARRGEERGNTYNVTVNGAMDSESTARQIVTLLNDSQARGTLGASGFAGLIAE
jgi:hypothetical protein